MTRPPHRPDRSNPADRPRRPRRPSLNNPNQPNNPSDTLPQIRGESPQAIDSAKPSKSQKATPKPPQIPRFEEEDGGFGDWIEHNSFSLVSWIGYGLLGLALLDFFFTLVPPRLFDPGWQLDAVGQLVGKVWAPLIGLMLIFFRGRGRIGELEIKILGWVSWLPLVFAIIYLLLIPATITNSLRLDQQNRTQANAQVLQQTQQINQIKETLQQANTPEQVGVVVAQVNRLPGIPRIDPTQVNNVKTELIKQLDTQKINIETNASANIRISQRRLIKNAARQVTSTLLAGLLFFKIWQLSNWARQYSNIVREQ
jgi:hypothetical protein